MDLDALKGQVQNLISQHADNQSHTGFDPAPLLDDVEAMFQQHAANAAPQTGAGGLMQQVMALVGQHTANQSDTGFNPGPLLGEVENLFRQQQ